MSRIVYRCCYQCEKRYVGCHSQCDDYLQEVENNNKIKEKERVGKMRYRDMKSKNKNYFSV